MESEVECACTKGGISEGQEGRLSPRTHERPVGLIWGLPMIDNLEDGKREGREEMARGRKNSMLTGCAREQFANIFLC